MQALEISGVDVERNGVPVAFGEGQEQLVPGMKSMSVQGGGGRLSSGLRDL
jgi:hypothetical protein